MVLKPDYQTFAPLFKSNGEKKGGDRAAPSDSTAWNISTQVKYLCLYTSDGAFIWKDCKLYANRPFVVWLEFILFWYNIYDAAIGYSNYDAIFV